jgi:acyl-CoA thioesterase I
MPRHPFARRAVRTSTSLALLLAAFACSDTIAPDPSGLEPPDRPPIPIPEGPVAAMPRGVHLVALSDSDGAVIAGGQGYVPTVRAMDDQGRPVPNLVVRFGAMARGGRVAVERVATDADGVASAGAWGADTTPGLQEVRAYVGDSTWTRFRLTAVPAAGPVAMDAQCPMNDSILPRGWSLPRVAARLAARRPLTVVAIGSSSTQGVGASVPDSSYPALLRRHLAAYYPASTIEVWNKGIGGQMLGQMRARFATDVFAYSPQLAILQTGTNDAIARVPMDAFAEELRTAIRELRAADIDVVLMDSQRYPGDGMLTPYIDYQALMARVAVELGVPLLRRFAWMTEMEQPRHVPWEKLLYRDYFHPSDLTYSCTGRMLAEGVVGAVAATVAR